MSYVIRCAIVLAMSLVLANCAKDHPVVPTAASGVGIVPPSPAPPWTDGSTNESCFVHAKPTPIVETVRFAHGVGMLDRQAAAKIRTWAARIKDLPSTDRIEVVLIFGTTDQTGDQKKNKKLQLKRADAVKDLLVSQDFPRDLVASFYGDMEARRDIPDINLDQRAAIIYVLRVRESEAYVKACPMWEKWPNYGRPRFEHRPD